MKSYKIRNVLEHEITVLLELAKSTFYNSYAHLNDSNNFQAYIDKTFSLEEFTAQYHHVDSIFYFVELEQQPVGYLKINRGKAQTEYPLSNALEIERIYIRKTHQGKGLGKQFILKVEDVARSQGMRHVWLGVWDQNPAAIAFYQRNGFKTIGTHVFRIGEEDQTDYMMAKPIQAR